MGNRQHIRNALYRRQKGKCFWCRRGMRPKSGHGDSITEDHLLPKSFGGTKHPRNIVGACWRCNLVRGNLLPAEWCKLLNTGIELPNLAPHRVNARAVRRNASIQELKNQLRDMQGVPWSKKRRPSFDPDAMGLGVTAYRVPLGDILAAKGQALGVVG